MPLEGGGVKNDWRPTPGQVALIEPNGAADCLTGVVLSVSGSVVIDLGASPRPPVDDCEVLASFFAPDALYRVKGVAHRHSSKDAVIDLRIDDVERVQRRTAARARLTLQAAMTAFADDGAFVSVVGETVDVGEGGCRVRTTTPFPAGRSPTLSLQLPSGGSLAISAEILQAETDEGHFDYRLAFLGLEASIREQLAGLASAD